MKALTDKEVNSFMSKQITNEDIKNFKKDLANHPAAKLLDALLKKTVFSRPVKIYSQRSI